MEWLYYLLEANLYLLLFYGFYRLFLQNETFYNNNRYYLLLSSITAFALPILQLGFLKPSPIIDNVAFPIPIIYGEEILTTNIPAPVQETFNITYWLYPIYLLIALGFAIKLGISLFKIIFLWLKANKAKTGNITLIELNEQTTAFSFFNLLFIHPHLAEKQTVLNHEMVHIKQKHSFDILFFEIIQIICWFNPIIYFIKKDIKLLHEYIADELSINSGIQKHEYAMFLIENSFGVVPTPLTNQIFNQSILKRRINMLNKKRTAGWARLKLLLTLPLVGAMLCASTMAFKKDYGYVDLLPEKSKTLMTVTQEVPAKKEQSKISPPPPKVSRVKFPPPAIQAISSDRFSPMYHKDKKTGKPVLAENRLIMINGKAVEDVSKFYGVYDAKSIVYRTKESSLAKYGNKGKNGTVEIIGNHIKYFTEVTIPSAPPVEPPPPGYKTKRDQVKFPPPVIRPDKKKIKNPPAVEPPPAKQKYDKDDVIYGDPTPSAKVSDKATDDVKFPPPIIKSDKISGAFKKEIDSNIKYALAGTTSYKYDRRNNISGATSIYNSTGNTKNDIGNLNSKNPISTKSHSAYTISNSEKDKNNITGTKRSAFPVKNDVTSIFKIDSLQRKK